MVTVEKGKDERGFRTLHVSSERFGDLYFREVEYPRLKRLHTLPEHLDADERGFALMGLSMCHEDFTPLHEGEDLLPVVELLARTPPAILSVIDECTGWVNEEVEGFDLGN